MMVGWKLAVANSFRAYNDELVETSSKWVRKLCTGAAGHKSDKGDVQMETSADDGDEWLTLLPCRQSRQPRIAQATNANEEMMNRIHRPDDGIRSKRCCSGMVGRQEGSDVKGSKWGLCYRWFGWSA